ncbi:hypothetical protein GLAREA_00083 [Glarea lozoyensis ATCC 20868]|uniref:BZIP domain-containing protein n=1 Tax=Glarea lozoyensis (strain ATCC 20868 / MF5171) TaxID=1116229 RepID=S3CTE4_GLAL2|nr:uncharacterized protein GLAREA_00083 [Glarea lozoyensis ATCC 20868]EPE28925.1 hypothetical protein GLAREA_00083 [Glarea lozoyensis ATCC 20868]
MAFQGTYTLFTPSHANHCDSQPADMDLFDEFTAFEGGASANNNFNHHGSAYSSPAVPTIYDPQMNLSSSSSINMGTVSPQDLLRSPFAGSQPPSTSFTNLTSPSTYNESPEYDESFEASPFVQSDNAVSGVDPWFPLFPADETTVEQPKSEDSPLLPEEELQVASHLRSASGGRRRSGTGTSPTGTHASIAGINARKRDKPLPPIVVEDPNDTVAMKRARNTLAARKSRQRKMQKFEELEDRIANLEAERDHWKDVALRRTTGQSG